MWAPAKFNLVRSKRTAAGPYVGPGDIVSGALAWWGLRAYTSASIGSNCVRLRESGGNTEQDFATIAGGGLNLGAISSFKGANNLFVVKVYDQSGNGFDFIQATAGNQLAFTLSGLGSFPTITGDASKWLYVMTGITQSQPFMTSSVSKKANSGTQEVLWGRIPSTVAIAGDTGNVADLFFLTAGTNLSVAATDNVNHAVQCTFNGGSSEVYVDGSGTSGAGGANVLAASGGMQWFALPSGGDPSIAAQLIWTGTSNELGIWTGAWTTEKAAMNTNQHAYWSF